MAPVAADADVQRKTELIEAFNLFDENGTGMLTVEGLRAVMRNLGFDPTYDEVADMLKEVASFDDKGVSTSRGIAAAAADNNTPDRVEFITRDQFVKFMLTRTPVAPTGEDEIRGAFNLIDDDGNGYISADELGAALRTLGENVDEQQLQAMIAEADVDGDGQVSFEEFRRVLTRPAVIESATTKKAAGAGAGPSSTAARADDSAC